MKSLAIMSIGAFLLAGCTPVPHGAAWNYLEKSCVQATGETDRCESGASARLRWKSQAEMNRINANATALIDGQKIPRAEYDAARARLFARYGGKAGYEVHERAVEQAVERQNLLREHAVTQRDQALARIGEAEDGAEQAIYAAKHPPGPTVADIRNHWFATHNAYAAPSSLACQWEPGLPVAFEMQVLQARGCGAGDVTVNPFDFTSPQTISGDDFPAY